MKYREFCSSQQFSIEFFIQKLKKKNITIEFFLCATICVQDDKKYNHTSLSLLQKLCTHIVESFESWLKSTFKLPWSWLRARFLQTSQSNSVSQNSKFHFKDAWNTEFTKQLTDIQEKPSEKWNKGDFDQIGYQQDSCRRQAL